MDRILNMFSNRSVRRFTAASLLCMLLCTLGGWALAEKQARQNVRLLQTQQLQIAGKLESSMPDVERHAMSKKGPETKKAEKSRENIKKAQFYVEFHAKPGDKLQKGA